MSDKTFITTNFGSFSVDEETARKAALTVASNAIDARDAAQLLDMLGLIDPLPENEPVILKEERLTPERKAERKKVRETQAERRARRLQEFVDKYGVTPDEIGE